MSNVSVSAREHRGHFLLGTSGWRASSRRPYIALKSFSSGIVTAVAKMVDPKQRAAFTAQVQSIRNRAVYEIPEILAGIMAR